MWEPMVELLFRQNFEQAYLIGSMQVWCVVKVSAITILPELEEVMCIFWLW